MAEHFCKLSRARLAVIFALLAFIGFRYAAVDANAADASAIAQYQEALAFTRGLAIRADGLFTEPEQRILQDAALRMQFTLNYWSQFPDPTLAAQAQRDCAIAVSQVYKMLDRSPQVERVWAVSGAPPQTLSDAGPWAGGSGAADRAERRDDPGPRVVRGNYDLSRSNEAAVDVGGAETTYAALFFSKAPEGEKHIAIKLRAGGGRSGSGRPRRRHATHRNAAHRYSGCSHGQAHSGGGGSFRGR